MSDFSKLFMEWFLKYPIVLPVAVGFVVTVSLMVVLFRRAATPQKKRIAEPLVSLRDAGEDEDSHANRRSSVRREGSPVKVMLSSPTFANGIESGYVVDRSTGGVRIITTMKLATGTTVQIRAQHAPENTPWVTVIVRNCKPNEQHFEIGCEFDRTPPWNVLLLFG